MSSETTSSTSNPTLAIAATPATPDLSDTGDSIALAVTPSAATPVVSAPHGSLREMEEAKGSMRQVPETEGKGLMIRAEGRHYNLSLTKEQQAKHDQLNNELLTFAGLNPAQAAKATINVTRGWVEIDGQIIAYLNENPKSESAKKLYEMRQLYHEVLGQGYSDMIWHEYAPGDRASTKDPLPYQQMKIIDPDKKLKFPEDQLTQPQLREFHLGKKLQKGLLDVFEKQKNQVRPSTEADSRRAQLGRLHHQYEELNELAMRYYAAHPVPDFSDAKKYPDAQSKFDAIQNAREEAVAFLSPLLKTLDSRIPGILKAKHSDDPEVQKALKAFALELALSACTTRRDYDQLCCAFRTFENTETQPCKTTPELFLMRLSHLAALNGNTDAFIDEQFEIAFSGLTHQEDKDEIRNQLTQLIKTTQEELNDATLQKLATGTDKPQNVTAYHTRIDQLEVLKKQNKITQSLRELAADLQAKRSDLTPTATRLERAARNLDRQVETPLKNARPEKELFKPFADAILGVPGATTRDTKEALVTALLEQLKALEEHSNQDHLRPFTNRLTHIINEQTALGEYLAEISGDSPALQRWGRKINPWHKPTDISSIGQ